MWKRPIAGALALVLSLSLLASPALAAETKDADQQAPAASDTTPAPDTGSDADTTPGTGGDKNDSTPGGDTNNGTGGNHNGSAETPSTPEAPAEPTTPTTPPTPTTPERPSTPSTPLPHGPTLRQDHVRYMEGFENGTFRPDQKLTRAQAAQLVYRLLATPDNGTGACSYTDIAGQWYTQPIRALCALGLFDNGSKFRPNDVMTRAEFIDLLVRTKPISGNSAGFPDVSSGYWAASQIQAAASHGWISGFPDGTFRPNSGLTRAEACTVVNNMLGRTGDTAQATRLIALGIYSDVSASYWGARTIAEASVSHTAAASGSGESWNGVDVASMTFTPGFHSAGNQLYYVAWTGKLVTNTTLGAYKADATGALTQTAKSYQMTNVPYISQIDNIYAWVGCEAVADLMGLKAKGYAQDVTIKYFLDNLPRSKSDPEKGFVGSPYVPDTSKRTRTTIYPAKLAEYSNTYCGSDDPCADFRGASVTDLQRELLAGNCVVGYMTLWWASPYYRTYNIEGTQQRLVSNNHAVLVCGYDPNKGYYISDPYNYYNRGQVHQYWENAKTFEAIWNARKVGMVIR